MPTDSPDASASLTPSTPPAEADRDSPLFRGLRGFNRVLLQTWHKVHILPGKPPLPRQGPFIIAPNHTAAIDPLLVQFSVTRPIRWMMAKEYMDLPGLKWFWNATGIIPVSRNGRDSTATRAALRVLESGGVLGVFPEGRISDTGQMRPLQPGLRLLAEHANAPVYPVWITGTQKRQGMLECFLRPNDAILAFGNPVHPTSADLITELTEHYNLLRNQANDFRGFSKWHQDG